MTWTRKERKMPTGEDNIRGLSLTYTAVTRHHSGIYICSADNGFGQPTVANLKLDVQRKFYKNEKKCFKIRNEFTATTSYFSPLWLFYGVLCCIPFHVKFCDVRPSNLSIRESLAISFHVPMLSLDFERIFQRRKKTVKEKSVVVYCKFVFKLFNILFQNASNFVFHSNFCWIRRNFSLLYLSK